MSLFTNTAGSVRNCLNCLHKFSCQPAEQAWWELAEDKCAGFEPEEGGHVFALVRADGLGKCKVERTCLAFTEVEAERVLELPESEEYVAGRLDGSDVYKSNDYYIDGPYASEKEAYEAIEG